MENFWKMPRAPRGQDWRPRAFYERVVRQDLCQVVSAYQHTSFRILYCSQHEMAQGDAGHLGDLFNNLFNMLMQVFREEKQYMKSSTNDGGI